MCVGMDIVCSRGIMIPFNVSNCGFGFYGMGAGYKITLLFINDDCLTICHRLGVTDVVYTVRDCIIWCVGERDALRI